MFKINYRTDYLTTGNHNAYSKLVKYYRGITGEISCSICPYHRIENHTKKTDSRSWKRYRKTQYKNHA